MSVQYDVTPRSLADDSNIATMLGAASLGSTIGVVKNAGKIADG